MAVLETKRVRLKSDHKTIITINKNEFDPETQEDVPDAIPSSEPHLEPKAPETPKKVSEIHPATHATKIPGHKAKAKPHRRSA